MNHSGKIRSILLQNIYVLKFSLTNPYTNALNEFSKYLDCEMTSVDS